MTQDKAISQKEIDTIYERLSREAESAGYHLNPDVEFTKDLVQSLVTNGNRYGYWACPCRLASGDKFEDLDIICPCDYRDADVTEYDSCYCALYVSQAAVRGEKLIHAIPERRSPKREEHAQIKEKMGKTTQHIGSLSKPVWRCKVCGYLCARDEPPEVCPVCKAKKDRFERFI